MEKNNKEEFKKMIVTSAIYIVYTDGSCHPGNSKGIITSAFRIYRNGKNYENSFASKYGDIGEAELRAVVEALKTIPDGCAVEVYTDSMDVIEHSDHPEKRKKHSKFWEQFDYEKSRLFKLSIIKVDKKNGTERNRKGNQTAHDLCQLEYKDYCKRNLNVEFAS